MTEAREFAFKISFTCEYVCPWLFDAHGLVGILFPLQAQSCIRMRPFGNPRLKS